MTYKVSEIKKMSFDCFHRTGEYMDHWKMDLRELNRFLCDCEYMFGKKWEPIYLSSDWSDSSMCAIIDTLDKHGYTTCFTGETNRDLRGKLEGHSSLLSYVKNSNFRQRCEKKRLKRIRERELNGSKKEV